MVDEGGFRIAGVVLPRIDRVGVPARGAQHIEQWCQRGHLSKRLVFAARHVSRAPLPLGHIAALQRGDVVLCDRFTDATFAYQGGGRGFDTGVLTQLEQWVQSSPQGLREPDVTLWFVLDPRIAAERLSQARVPDRFESQPVTFFENVHHGYQRRCDAAPGRFVRIEADRTREQVWASVESALRKRGVLS